MKIVVTIDEDLLAHVDRAARRLGLTRSAYLVRLATRDIRPARGIGRKRQIREALAAIDRLVDENPTLGDSTAFIREMRDARATPPR